MRDGLSKVPTYVAGKPPATKPGIRSFKISSNENPYSTLPELLAELNFDQINRYPDFASTRLTTALSEKFNLPMDNFVCGTGSVGILQQVVQAVANPGDEMIHAWRSFEAYPIVAPINAVTNVAIPLRADETHDLSAMAAAITDRTRLIFLCTPNNPTGTAVRASEFEEFFKQVPEHVTVVFDEAYVEFVTDSDVANSLKYFQQHQNIVVLRTFSKAYGLAGLRVGFAIAHSEMAEAIRKCTVPFGVSGIAEDAAVLALKYEPALLKRVASIVSERERLVSGLTSQGWKLPNSQANFVWLRIGDLTPQFTQACSEVGLSVRPYGSDGVRITIGEEEANSRVLEVCSVFFDKNQDEINK